MTAIDTNVTEVGRAPRISLADLLKTVSDGFSAAVISLMDWQYRARERRQVLGLSDRALQDFAASRADAENAGTKPFWH